MASYKLSNLAKEDLARIYEYGIENFGLSRAQSYLLGLQDQFERLAKGELYVRDASIYANGLKQSQFKREVIFHLPDDEDILIVRVLGKNMDFMRHLDL